MPLRCLVVVSFLSVVACTARSDNESRYPALEEWPEAMDEFRDRGYLIVEIDGSTGKASRAYGIMSSEHG